LLGVLLVIPFAAYAGNPTPGQEMAWSENAGWINFNAASGGSSLFLDHLEGYAWSENVGWIQLGTYTGGGPHTYANSSAMDWGVNRNGLAFSGYAWSETAGWISFAPANGGVTIDPYTGVISGWAWSENVGWIHLRNASPNYGVAFAAADVPALSTWALLLLATLLAVVALRTMQ
jgi:hypothetical protein